MTNPYLVWFEPPSLAGTIWRGKRLSVSCMSNALRTLSRFADEGRTDFPLIVGTFGFVCRHRLPSEIDR